MVVTGQDFIDQIDTSGSTDNFKDYDVGSTVIITDKVARMEFVDGVTKIWLDSIGKAENNVPFIFKSNLMGEYGVGSRVIIEFQVVTDSNGHHTAEGYQNEPPGLDASAISTGFANYEYVFIALAVLGVGVAFYGVFTNFVRTTSSEAEDDWGLNSIPAALPPQHPPVAPPPQQPPLAPPAASASLPPQPSSVTITVPPGVVPGQVLTVTMPSGQKVNVQVPSGCQPGSQFTISVTQ